MTYSICHVTEIILIHHLLSSWWFHFFIFTPIWGRFPFWLIFFKGLVQPPTSYVLVADIKFHICILGHSVTQDDLGRRVWHQSATVRRDGWDGWMVHPSTLRKDCSHQPGWENESLVLSLFGRVWINQMQRCLKIKDWTMALLSTFFPVFGSTRTPKLGFICIIASGVDVKIVNESKNFNTSTSKQQSV